MLVLSFADLTPPKGGTVLVTVAQGVQLSPAAQTLDAQAGGALSRAAAAQRFKGKRDEVLTVLAPADLPYERAILLGIGALAELDGFAAERIGAQAIAALKGVPALEATLLLDQTAPGIAAADLAGRAGIGAHLRAWSFDRYKAKPKDDAPPRLEKLTIATGDPAAAETAFALLHAVAEGIELARTLVSEPPNALGPVEFVETVQTSFKGVKNTEIEVLGEKAMRKAGLNLLLAVGQGSARESQLLIIDYAPDEATRAEAPLMVVGKGVTFDTGGISIKPAGGMEDMKWDMAGAGAVAGFMRAVAARGAKAHIVGICGLAENMPDGLAQRPGDVVRGFTGTTVEVINTDAEGRLVLADALGYGIDRFKPHTVIDLATLTGAILVALGSEFAGLFTPDDQLAERLLAAGRAVDEPLWRMPLAEAYEKPLESDVADLRNVGHDRNAGSAMAAMFLKRFVGTTSWAHLDIAGTAWSKRDRGTVPKGATAYGVRLLDHYVRTAIEGVDTPTPPPAAAAAPPRSRKAAAPKKAGA